MIKFKIKKFIFEFFNLKFLIPLIASIIIVTLNSYDMFIYSSVLDFQLNVIESSIVAFNDYAIMTVLIIAILTLLSGLPFIDKNDIYIIFRINLKSWINKRILLLFLNIYIFITIIILINIIIGAIFLRANLQNDWSDLYYYFVQNNNEIGDVTIINSNITSIFSPFTTLLISVLLICSYSFFLGLVLFACNIVYSKYIGYAISIFIHAIGYILNLTQQFNFSLFSRSMLTNNFYGLGYPTSLNSAILLLSLNIIMIFVINIIIGRPKIKDNFINNFV